MGNVRFRHENCLQLYSESILLNLCFANNIIGLEMFLLLASVRHVGAHADRRQHGVSIPGLYL